MVLDPFIKNNFFWLYQGDLDFPGGSMVKKKKNPPASSGDAALIPGSGSSPGGGHGNPLQCSCLENPTDRGAWRATVHGVTESDMTVAT